MEPRDYYHGGPPSSSMREFVTNSEAQLNSGNYVNIVPIPVGVQYHHRRKYSPPVRHEYQSRIFYAGEYVPRDRYRDEFYPIASTPVPLSDTESIRSNLVVSPPPNVSSLMYTVQRVVTTSQFQTATSHAQNNPNGGSGENTIFRNDMIEYAPKSNVAVGNTNNFRSDIETTASASSNGSSGQSHFRNDIENTSNGAAGGNNTSYRNDIEFTPKSSRNTTAGNSLFRNDIEYAPESSGSGRNNIFRHDIECSQQKSIGPARNNIFRNDIEYTPKSNGSSRNNVYRNDIECTPKSTGQNRNNLFRHDIDQYAPKPAGVGGANNVYRQDIEYSPKTTEGNNLFRNDVEYAQKQNGSGGNNVYRNDIIEYTTKSSVSAATAGGNNIFRHSIIEYSSPKSNNNGANNGANGGNSNNFRNNIVETQKSNGNIFRNDVEYAPKSNSSGGNNILRNEIVEYSSNSGSNSVAGGNNIIRHDIEYIGGIQNSAGSNRSTNYQSLNLNDSAISTNLSNHISTISTNYPNNISSSSSAASSASASSAATRHLQNVIPTCVYLMSKIAVHMEIEGTAQCPAQVMLAAALGCEELGIANKLLAQSVFGLWMTSPLLEIQLKPHNRPYEVRTSWAKLLDKYSHGDEIEKKLDDPIIGLKRSVYFSKKDEEKIKDPRIIELLYEEARHNVLSGRYIMEPAHSIMLGGIQAKVELGPYNVNSHTISYFREVQSRFLPAHVAKNSSWSWLPISRKTSAEVRLLEQYKRVPTTATTRKLMRKYLEFCWALPFYGAAFFHGQVEQPVRGLMSLVSHKDIPVLIAINEKGLFIIDHYESTLLLGLRYGDLSWDFAKPSVIDDPDCLPCIFIQFDAMENGVAMSKLMQVFSRQAAMMDALLSYFTEQIRRRREGFDGHPPEFLGYEEPNLIKNNGVGVLSNKVTQLTLATFDEEERCIGQNGSLSISF